nr:MAG: replication associated protein [Cressdnaviricota sp.]
MSQVYNISFRWSLTEKIEKIFFNEGPLIEKMKELAEKYIFQLEKTDENNYHYQGYANLSKKVRPKTLAKQLNEEFLGINIQAAHDSIALEKYCMKKETRIKGPWADKKIYMGQDLNHPFKEWQNKCKDICLSPMETRKIYWICDPKGGEGKTYFIKYMTYYHDCCPITFGKASDLLNMVSTNQGKNAYLFNLTRSKGADAHMADIYQAMESIKDGMFINTKYKTGVVMMEPPHIIIFGNTYPDRSSISQDRWVILTLKDGVLQE